MVNVGFTEGETTVVIDGLTQWDRGRKLRIVDDDLPAAFEVHFAPRACKTAYVVEATATGGVATVGIPDEALQHGRDIRVYIYIDGKTVKTIVMPVSTRPKPEDYVYTPSERLSYADVIKHMNALENDIARYESRITRNAKRITNLELLADNVQTDDTTAYQKTVPSLALPYAEVTEIGGMSYAVDGELKHTPVTTIESVGYNILDLTPALNNCLVDNGDGTYTMTKIATNGRFSEFIPLYIPKGQQVFCYLEIVSTNIDGLIRIPFQLFGADKQDNGASIGISNGGQAFAPTADTFFAKAYLQANDAVGAYVTFRNPMIKYGKSAEFSPYAKHTLPIPLEVQALEGYGMGISTDCHNRLIWDPETNTKQFRWEVGIVDMGDLSYTYRTSNGRNIFGTYVPNIRGFATGDAPLPAVAVGYRAVRVGDTWVDGDMAYGNSTIGYNKIEFVNNAYTDVESFKVAMKGRYLVYALATPRTTNLSQVLTDDNYIKVEPGGTITAANEHGLAAPTEITYQLTGV